MVGNYIFPLDASNLLASAKFKEDQESSKKTFWKAGILLLSKRIITRDATRFNNPDDLLELDFALKISIFSAAYL